MWERGIVVAGHWGAREFRRVRNLCSKIRCKRRSWRRKVVNFFNFQSQTEQWNCLEEIRLSENPFQYGIVFARGEERKDDLRGETDGSQPIDRMIDNLEARSDFFVDRRELHLSSSLRIWSLDPCSQRRIILNTIAIHWRGQENPYDFWMLCKKAEKMIIGTLMVSRSSQYWLTNLFYIYVVGECGFHKLKQTQDLIICGQKFGLECPKTLNERKSCNGLSINRSLTMRERWEALILSIRNIGVSKKPLKTHGKSWNWFWKQPYFKLTTYRYREICGGSDKC